MVAAYSSVDLRGNQPENVSRQVADLSGLGKAHERHGQTSLTPSETFATSDCAESLRSLH